MIKDIDWLRDKLSSGTTLEKGSTILVLDQIDCKSLLRDLNRYTVVPRTVEEEN